MVENTEYQVETCEESEEFKCGKEVSELAAEIKELIKVSDEINTEEEAKAFIEETDKKIVSFIAIQSDLQAKNIDDIQKLEYNVELNPKTIKKLFDMYGKSVVWNSLEEAYTRIGQVAKLEELYILVRNVARLEENKDKEIVSVRIKAVEAHIVTQLIETTSGKGFNEAKTFIKLAGEIATAFKPIFDDIKTMDKSELVDITAKINAYQSVLYESIIPKFKVKGIYDFTIKNDNE